VAGRRAVRRWKHGETYGEGYDGRRGQATGEKRPCSKRKERGTGGGGRNSSIGTQERVKTDKGGVQLSIISRVRDSTSQRGGNTKQAGEREVHTSQSV